MVPGEKSTKLNEKVAESRQDIYSGRYIAYVCMCVCVFVSVCLYSCLSDVLNIIYMHYNICIYKIIFIV